MGHGKRRPSTGSTPVYRRLPGRLAPHLHASLPPSTAVGCLLGGLPSTPAYPVDGRHSTALRRLCRACGWHVRRQKPPTRRPRHQTAASRLVALSRASCASMTPKNAHPCACLCFLRSAVQEAEAGGDLVSERHTHTRFTYCSLGLGRAMPAYMLSRCTDDCISDESSTCSCAETGPNTRV